jgi:regulator of protease activity HflC (stomatin/prohibitin superfamily)
MSTLVLVILLIVLVALVVVVVRFSFRTIPQANAGIVERFGRYHRTLQPGPHVVVPFVDRVRPLIDLREQVVSFSPHSVLTSDKVRIKIEPVIYFRVSDVKAATYEVDDYLSALQELTMATLRKVADGMDMETTLRSRNQFNIALMNELARPAGEWGLRVSRAELQALDPPSAIQESIERQKRAEHEKSATELTAQGQSSAIVIRAMAEAAAQAVRAQGQAEGITRVFQAIAAGDPEKRLLIYQYLQAQGNRAPVGSPEVGQFLPDGQVLGLSPAAPGGGRPGGPGSSGCQGRARSSTLPSAVTRVSKDGWRAVAGPWTTVPSEMAKVDPCHGQAMQAPPRSMTTRPWCSGPPRCEQRSDSTLTSGPCRYTSSDR